MLFPVFPEMPERLSTNSMRGKGSITVFLSLILVLLFSFLMTVLEAARIRGASAYVAMVSELAGDSFLASYYYPLFQQYRLFGVDGGNSDGYFSRSTLEEDVRENVEYGITGLDGGLLTFENTEVAVTNYETIMAEEGAEYLSQIREQIVLDGLSLAISELFTEEEFIEAGATGQIYQKQEEALSQAATVTKELLSLMELTDGIRTGSHGLIVGKDGKLQSSGIFIKQLLPMDEEELKSAYENEEIYEAVSSGFYRADQVAVEIKELVQKIIGLEKDIEDLETVLAYHRQNYASLQAEWRNLSAEEEPEEETLAQLESAMRGIEWAIESAEMEQEHREEQRKEMLSEAKLQYKALKKVLENVEPVLKKGLLVLESLEKKQEKARGTVIAYEAFLTGMESLVSAEVYEVFEKELETMKLYVGLEEQGYYVPTMRASVTQNLSLVQGCSMEGFSEKELERIVEEMEVIAKEMSSYTAEGLWFTYGEIVAAEQNGANVFGALAELLTTGVLELVGVSKEEQSERTLDGEALPSAGLEGDSFLTDLMGCISEVEAMFVGGGIGAVLSNAGNAMLDATALELYCMKYFHSFVDESEVTRLKYEREYLVFGSQKDKTNLLCMVLYLVAIRTLFALVGLLKQPDKMAAVEAFAAGVAGCTGIPVLLAVIKYALLLLWAVEEALVEVAALLLGKRIPVVGNGTISMGELLFINKTMIASKASALPDGLGPGYEDYLVLLSLTRSTRKKMYRSMDLIQENLRYRYRDSFRMRNVVTELTFSTKSDVKLLYDTGWFPEEAYSMEWEEQCAY